MKIILKKEVANLGEAGDVVEVSQVTAATILSLRDSLAPPLSPLLSSLRRQSARGLTKRPSLSLTPRLSQPRSRPHLSRWL